MPKTKREKILGKRWTTRYPNIYVYWTKRYGWRYQVRFNYTVNGVEDEYSESGFASQAEALAVYNEVYPRLTKGDAAFLNADEVTFKERWEQVINMKLRSGVWNNLTYTNSVSNMQIFLDRFGDFTLSDINNRSLIQNWIYEVYDNQDMAPSSMGFILQKVKLVINDAVEEEILNRNRLSKVNTDIPDHKPKNKVLSEHNYKRFMKAASDETNMPFHFYTAIRLFSYGLRLSEVSGIKKKTITFQDDGTALIYLEDNLKTESSKRIQAVDRETANLLRRVLDRASEIKRKHNSILHEEDYIFLNEYTGSAYHNKSFYNQVKRLGKQLNIDVHPHMFRHTYATKALSKGVDSLMLQKVLGHANTTMTSHYAKGTEATANAVLKMMSDSK